MIDVKPYPRKFIPQNFVLNTWDDIQSFVTDLESRELDSLDAYQKFLDESDEFARVLGDEFAWRYIRMTCNTADKEIEEKFNYFIEHISPKLSEFSNAINQKMATSPFAKEVTDTGFSLAMKGILSEIELFRAENIPLDTQIEQLSAEFVKVKGSMTVTLDGEEMTLQKAGDRLFWTDRAKREEAWKASRVRMYEDHEKIDQLYADMTKLRHQIALNAGFENYRDYKFKSLKRYDYTPEDCYTFHDAIEKAVMPLVRELTQRQVDELGMTKMKPWDGAVDPKGLPPLKAFKDEKDLVEKSLQLFADLDPVFHDTVMLMKERNQLDLGSRLNKAPGGYMYPLSESKVPFIFANATEKVNDLVTLIHEVGHAVHEILKRDLRLAVYGSYPSEVAELASMSMELLTLDRWDIFFTDPKDCKRAKREHLEKIIEFFPWMAQVDAFQHEVYLNPEATVEERYKIWSKIQSRFTTNLVDWNGFEDWHKTVWHRQGHIFEIPFYYVEYGIAQLGALQIWRNYKQDKTKALQQYKDALALGYTKSIPEIYEAAGIKFDFSADMLKDLMAFVQKELKELE